MNHHCSIGQFSRRSVADRLYIQGIGVGLPAARQHIAAASRSLGLSGSETRMFQRLFGLENFAYDEMLPLGSLLALALRDLAARHPVALNGVSHVFHCHTIPSVTPLGWPTANGLERADTEYASLAMNHCATGITALSLALDILGPEEKALIIIGEKAYHPRIRLIANTTIMGEATAAVVVGRQRQGFEVLATRSDHDGQWATSRGHPREEAKFDRDYIEFAETHIRAALSQFSVDIDDIGLVLPHNVNTISWMTLARRLGLQPGRVFLQNVAAYGHCFGADPFINAMDAVACGKAVPGSLALMMSVGMGLTAASALVRIPSDIYGED